MKTDKQILLDAAELLEKAGWTQDYYFDPDTGCRCLIGALSDASGLSFSGLHFPSVEDEDKLGRLAGFAGAGQAINWNNAASDASEVITLLRTQAEKLNG